MATILIIDDSERHRAEIRGTIDGSGLFERVLEAPDGLRGLRLLLAERVDVVVCDLELPGLDGEELLVLLPQNTLAGAETMAERWRHNIEQARFELPGGQRIGVTVSIGLSAYHGDFETPDELIASADRALYSAKRKGRNCLESSAD